MRHMVFVIGNYQNGGVAMHATNLANEIASRGFKVTILVTKKLAREPFFDLHKSVRLIQLDSFKKENETKQKIIRDMQFAQCRIRWYKRFRYISRFIKCWDEYMASRIRYIRKGQELRPFILLNRGAIYIPFGVTYYEQVYCAAEGLGCKIIYAERNAPQVELPEEKEAKRFLDLLGKASGAVFQTEEEKRYYDKVLNKNTKVIHNPIKRNLPEPYEGLRRNIIVNFCRIAHQKNLKLLVDAFTKLHNEYEQYSLEIYGNAVEESEEVLREELREYVEQIGMQQHIKILLPIADVHQRIRDCAMFVSSSDFEGLSNSMIEAMAIGMPCVCTDCLGGGAREVIQNEQNGLLVPIRNVDALYGAMKRMIEDPTFAEQCGRKAAEIRNSQSVENIVDEWLEIIENV